MHNVEIIEKGFRFAAVPVALISAYFTYKFAASTMQSDHMGFLLGVALAICALASGYVWTVRQFASQHGASRTVLGFMAIAGVMFTGTDAFTNAGSLLWQRAASDNAATVQNVRFDDKRKAVADAEERIKFFEGRIADLKRANPWITTVSAKGLKGNIPAIDEAIKQEAKRGGCGPKCLALKEKLASLTDQIAKAEQLGEHEVMLASAHAGLEKARKAAAESTSVVSATSSQTASLATLVTRDLNPSSEAQAWTGYIVGLGLAVFLTFGPMAMNWIGFGGWRHAFGVEASSAAHPEHSQVQALQNRISAALKPANDKTVVTYATIGDLIAARRQGALTAA